jgi:hypothetical protein
MDVLTRLWLPVKMAGCIWYEKRTLPNWVSGFWKLEEMSGIGEGLDWSLRSRMLVSLHSTQSMETGEMRRENRTNRRVERSETQQG